MGDPKTIRINDADDPDRLEKLEKALKKSGQNLSEVMRHFADAYIKFVAKHRHGPSFPVRIESIEAPEVKKPGK